MKRGRKKLPDGLKCVTTSIRLRPDRLEVYRKLGGIHFLNMILDEQIYINTMFKDENEVATGRQVSP